MILGIQPVEAYPNSGQYIRVYDGQVVLGYTAKFLYYLLDTSGTMVSVPTSHEMLPSVYDAWTGSDTYVAATIAQSIGLTPLSGLY